MADQALKTLVLGASTNPARYAYKAAHQLRAAGHPVVPVGLKKGELAGEPILDLRDKPPVADVDTVTLYVGPQNQPDYYDYILSLQPRRIIFNPGTENHELMQQAADKGIAVEEACTLVMLSIGNY